MTLRIRSTFSGRNRDLVPARDARRDEPSRSEFAPLPRGETLRDQKLCFASEVPFSATNPRDQKIALFFPRGEPPSRSETMLRFRSIFLSDEPFAIRNRIFFFGAANPLRERKLCFASEVFFSATNPSRSENRTFLRAVNPFAIRSNASLPKYLSQDGLNAALTFSATNLRDQKIAFFFARRTLRERKLCFASEVFFSATNPSRSEKSQFFFRGDLPSRSEIMLRFRSTFCSDEPARQQKFMALRFRGLEPYSGSSPHPVSHPNCQ